MNDKIAGLLKSGSLKRKLKNDIRNDLWVFSSTDNRAFNYNSSYLFLYVKDNIPEVTPRYVINDEALRKQLSVEYGEEYFIDTSGQEGMRTALEAGVWFTSAGLPVYGFDLSDSRLVINLWHGIPLKKIALKDPAESRLQKLYFRKIFSKNYSYIFTTAPSLIPLMAESFGVPEDKIRVFNEPRLDALKRNFDRDAFIGVKYGSVPEYEKVILYAPTHRDGDRVRLFPFEDYDRDRMEAFLEEKKAIILVRTHSYEKLELKQYMGKRILPFNEDVARDVTECLSGVDALITDYSSIYLEYLLLERPMVFLPYDLEDYTARHGFNFDYDKAAPGEKPASFDEFCGALGRALLGDFDRERIKKLKEYFYSGTGASCPAICEFVIEKIGGLEK